MIGLLLCRLKITRSVESHKAQHFGTLVSTLFTKLSTVSVDSFLLFVRHIRSYSHELKPIHLEKIYEVVF